MSQDRGQTVYSIEHVVISWYGNDCLLRPFLVVEIGVTQAD